MENGDKSTTFGAIINIAKLSIGNGILALPFATSRGGLLFSPLAIALIAAWNVVSCFMMIECKQVLAHKSFPLEISSSYSRISYCAFGHWGAVVTDLSVFVTLFGVCISYQIAFAQFLKDIPSNPLQEWSELSQTIGYSYLSMLIVFPLSCQQNLGFLAKTSFAGLSCLLVSIGVLIGYGLSTFQPELQNISELSLWPETLTSFSTFSGVAIFCFGLCTFTFPIEESMQDRKEFPKAVIWSTIIITIFYSLIGDLLAFIYAQDEVGINQNILHHLPIHSTPAILVRLALAIVCLVSLPLALAPTAQIFDQWVLGMYKKFVNSRQLQLTTSHRSPDYQSFPQSDSENRGDESVDSAPLTPVPDLFRYVSRFFLLVTCSFLAGHVPCFELVVSLLGSFTVCLLSFVLPSTLHLVLIVSPQLLELEDNNESVRPPSPRIQWVVDALLTALGCCVCVFATWMTALEAYQHFQSFGHC